jgi:hypothetical protein
MKCTFVFSITKLIQRATLKAELEEEFVNFELATIKAQNIRNVNEKEIQRYNAEKQIICILSSEVLYWAYLVEKSNQAQQEITSLREELRESKLERGQKVQYDELTRATLKKTPKTRSEQIAYHPKHQCWQNSAIEKLRSELEDVENELSSYSMVWDARKRTFDNILNNLEVLRREVEDEKEQQDRKEGMNEGSDHEEEEGQVTGTQTPAVKEVEERGEREQSRDSGEVDEDVKEQLASSLPTESHTPAAKDSEIDMDDVEDEDEDKTVEGENKMDIDR